MFFIDLLCGTILIVTLFLLYILLLFLLTCLVWHTEQCELKSLCVSTW